jgi:hypothetical protein
VSTLKPLEKSQIVDVDIHNLTADKILEGHVLQLVLRDIRESGRVESDADRAAKSIHGVKALDLAVLVFCCVAIGGEEGSIGQCVAAGFDDEGDGQFHQGFSFSPAACRHARSPLNCC